MTDVQWRETAPGRVTISQTGPLAARLFGLPFLAVGAYFLYQLVGGLLHPGELTVAGGILLPLMTAAFLVPGWLLTVVRKRATIDTGAREAAEEYDFLIFTRRTRTPIASGAFVLLRYERGAERTTRGALTTSSRTGFLLPVHLVSDKRHVLLGLFGERDKEAALAFARRVSALLGIDIQDRCFEGGEVTSGGVVVTRNEDSD